jgi:hypothetical protein
MKSDYAIMFVIILFGFIGLVSLDRFTSWIIKKLFDRKNKLG